VQSIFTNQVPAAQNNDGPYTLGTFFFSAVPGFVFGVRWYCPTIPPTAPLIGALFEVVDDTTGILLAQTTFGALTPDAWNTSLFATPQAIAGGHPPYYGTCVRTLNNYVATGNVFTGGPITNGDLTAIQTGTDSIRNGKFHVGATLTYPEQTFNGANYFVDTLFDTVLPGGASGGHSHGHTKNRSSIPMMMLGGL
jgi:hypothetical protein